MIHSHNREPKQTLINEFKPLNNSMNEPISCDVTLYITNAVCSSSHNKDKLVFFE